MTIYCQLPLSESSLIEAYCTVHYASAKCRSVVSIIFSIFTIFHHFDSYYLSLFFPPEKLGEVDTDEVACSAWSNKQPKVVQPDLNYIGKSRTETGMSGIWLFIVIFENVCSVL